MDKQQKAYLLLIVFVLAPLTGWTGLGFPIDRLSLGALASSIIGGVIGFVAITLKGETAEKSKQQTSSD